ncbi:uncharacterized protein LOC116846804 isoform X5 [Odontomachus brunneus]|uniref:uncharacterized protein LOC116846804 isoform X5 n=1 Tax=Odontomachus brunneus TaxID=486640 RepID=UPI0013F230A8|nr:uncharacterized protein LOC116846804 isoform X5 [Odontomachus brunneus]XP_032677005.1 uncharacterized protein LOC116846804 isoform X5 [Odontomachus brunneus]XP_032677006.1 uncharacterized protein LOC116846804 isoform X5 [Odontomachus brunneus]XP_032677008.1 uncharacterized protein LOC116846804 isoform X5 [Odontomachus brunneus]
MEDAVIALDSTVRSQHSSHSKESKDSANSESKPESCLESKHSKDVLIPEKRPQQQQQHHHQSRQRAAEDRQDHRLPVSEAKDDSNLLMFTSCGQLLLGVVLVVFGILVLVHGASLGGSGAGLWAGAGALVAGALGVVATLATSSTKTNSAFSSAHLASSLIALALSNMAAITALTAVVRDSQRTPEVSLLSLSGVDGNVIEVDGGLAGLLASIGLLVASVAELLVSGYSCLTLTPKLCGCLRANAADETVNEGHLKTRNMVHQWVIAQNHVPKSQPIYVVQPVMPMHPMIQPPYGMPPAPPGKFPGGFVPAGPLPISAPGYGPVPVLPHMPYAGRPPSQMFRPKHKRQQVADQEEPERKRQVEAKSESPKRMSSIGEDQIDLAQTYTGLDKRISEEFISIAMDPDRKSKASSNHGSEIGTKTF